MVGKRSTYFRIIIKACFYPQHFQKLFEVSIKTNLLDYLKQEQEEFKYCSPANFLSFSNVRYLHTIPKLSTCTVLCLSKGFHANWEKVKSSFLHNFTGCNISIPRLHGSPPYLLHSQCHSAILNVLTSSIRDRICFTSFCPKS